MPQTLFLRSFLTALLSLMILAGHAAALDASKFVGLWEVDFDRTMEELKKSPKYKPEDIEKMPAMIKGMMARMKVKFSEKEFTFVQGGEEMSLPYTVKSETGASSVLAVKPEGKDETLTVTLIDGKFLNVKSSDSNDLDYYIWKHAP